MFLDSLKPSKVTTYFELGLNGNLGVNDGFVTHRKKFYANAISAHAPSSIEYELDGSYYSFEADVAINDIKEGETCNPVNFSVYADDRLVGYVPRVMSHEISKTIQVNIRGAKKLRLETNILHDSYNNWCQSVWLLPQIHQERILNKVSATSDATIALPDRFSYGTNWDTKRCLFTTCHSDDIDKVDRMLTSFVKHNESDATEIVLFASGDIDDFSELDKKYNMLLLVECDIPTSVPLNTSVIAALGVHNTIDSDVYLYISPEMLIMDDISDLFVVFDNLGDDGVLVASNPNTTIVGRELKEIISSPKSIYGGQGVDCDFLHMDDTQRHSYLSMSTNVMCFTKKSLLSVEQIISDMMPHALRWKNNNHQIAYIREQAIINLAIAKFGTSVEMNHRYNCQLSENNFSHVVMNDDKSIHYNSENQNIKIIEVNSIVTSKFWELLVSDEESE